MGIFVRGISLAAIGALGLATFAAGPATASSPLSATASTSLNDAPTGDATPSPSDDNASTQKYSVSKRGSKISVRNRELTTSSLRVSGTVFEVAAELPGDPTTFLMLDSGTSVPIDIDLPDGVGSGSAFSGTLSLTPPVSQSLGVSVGGSAPISATSKLGELVTDASVETETELPVEEGTFTDAPVTSALIGTSREMNVAWVLPANGYGTVGGLSASQRNTIDAHLTAMIDTTEAYWVRESEGAISALSIPSADSDANSTGHFPVIQSNYICSSSTAAVNMWSTAWTYYKANVYNTAASIYSFVAVVPNHACESRAGFIGLGNVGNGFSYSGQYSSGGTTQALSSTLIDARSTGAGSGGVLIHELGHNFGLGHSDLFGCTSSSYIDYKYSGAKTCNTYEYYDLFDPMGFEVGDPGVLSAPHKIKLGILTAGDGFTAVPSLGSGTESSTTDVTISPISDSSGNRAIRVKDPVYGKYFYIEYRSGSGADAGALYTTEPPLESASTSETWSMGSGVRVLKYYSDGTGGDDTLALASIPDATHPNDRALAMHALDGFTSYGGGVQIDVVSESSTEAEIRVTLRHEDVMAPKLKGPTLSGTAAVGSTLTLTGAKDWHIPGASFSKKWLRGGISMCGQSSYSYTIQAYEKAIPITLNVTAKRNTVITGVASPTVTVSSTATTEVTAPVLSLASTKQRFGSGPGITATVALDGSLDGTIAVIDCSTPVAEGIEIDPDGTTTFELPTSIGKGSHYIRAVYVPSDGSVHYGAVSNYKTITVYKGTVPPEYTLPSSTGTKDVLFPIEVTMPEIGGRFPSGKVALYIDGKRAAIHTLVDGATTFNYTPRSTGTKTFSVHFGGNGWLYSSKAATTSAVFN
jgi:hypothetical protein